ncbi:MAG: phosphoribosyl-AMP cyclohydrolase [Microbacteriaceae bacterium]|nr:phosphoribosyl-AMP cyclohydrolase [Cryobacterium sp.]MBX3104357.1 phosphoribosyl-AMP cyclohydrolase [Cryobacterium sp.]MCC6375578.1 phosphoribosyl-AMP cyclohydrolase [Microbacteriaceae bacterium]
MTTKTSEDFVSKVSFGDSGLVPAIVQETATSKVLMLAWQSKAALERTLEEGIVTFWSRSRQELWRKGDTSGNHLRLVEATLDCDSDAILLLVEPVISACHTGSHSCFDAGSNVVLSSESDS